MEKGNPLAMQWYVDQKRQSGPIMSHGWGGSAGAGGAGGAAFDFGVFLAGGSLAIEGW